MESDACCLGRILAKPLHSQILSFCCRWQVSPNGPHQRNDNSLQADQWSYNIPVPGGAIYTAQVSLLQGKIIVPFSGILSMLLSTGASTTVPVQGVYTGTTYAPAVSPAHLIKAYICLLWMLLVHVGKAMRKNSGNVDVMTQSGLGS